ncbi:MAG: hypothetical protein ACXW4H_00465 [Candidatus Limnocylindrales bacterium]
MFAALGLVLAMLGPAAASTAAADLPTMEAHALLAGNARIGSWMAIQVHLVNNGPAVTGELRLAGGTQGQTRFGTAVDLPTQSDKTYVLYAQPPAFGSELAVSLTQGDQTVVGAKVKFTIHDATQLMVAVVAEHPEGIVGNLGLLPNQNQLAPLVMSLTPEDLPDRVEAWGALDRVVWQDVDADRLSPAQLEALRGWVAGGGRLVIAGGTAGPKVLGAFPDTLLPYRPVTTTDVPAASLGGILGVLPGDATALPALSGELIDGRSLASAGGRVVAADRGYGSGQVTLLGFDPTATWIVDSKAAQGLWRRLLPARSSGGLTFADDSMLVSAVSQFPSLALPPIGGLIVLLAAYILLIGPINYLILRRLDRREWAWLTMPILVIAFTLGAYGFGTALRGNDVIVNEVAIVHGAAGATDGTGQIYLGVFSPSRGQYQLQVPGGALLSSPINGDVFGGTGAASQLDVLQGDPARVRNLEVGFGSLRTIRAETAVTVPLVQADLRLEDGHLRGTVTNASTEALQDAAVVLGGTVVQLNDLAPGADATVDTVIQNSQFGQSLSDKVVGQIFFSNGTATNSSELYARHSMVDQLTYDPNFGMTGVLDDESPVVLAWGTTDLLPVEVQSQQPKRISNVLYYLPARMTVRGATTFRSGLIRSSVVQTDAAFFNKDPFSMNFGRGTATVAYRPTSFEGTLDVTEVAIGLNFGDNGITVPATQVEPLASIPPRCPNPPTADCAPVVQDGLPEVEVFDVSGQDWKRLPHLSPGPRYSLSDPARYVDPSSGTVLVRYVNDRQDNVGFSVDFSITGTVR